MSFKSIVRDFRRSSLSHHRQPAAAWAEEEEDDRKRQGKWANMPPELLMDILMRVDAGQVSWPARRNVVACAAVCRSWREIMKELISSPQISGRITFPISLKMPGPRDSVIQCFIKRERATSTYRLYHGLSPALQEKGDKLLLAARKVRRAASSHFVISLASDEFSRASCTYVGKLKSNFLGSKFTIYDSQPPGKDVPSSSSSRSNRRFHAKQVSPRLPIVNYSTGSIAYELNVLRGRGPRRMLVTMHTIPVSALQDFDHFLSTPSLKKEAYLAADFFCSSLNSEAEMRREPLILKNKAPRWHEQLQCWCLNFKGRVTVASVKNFQLVAMIDPPEQEKVVIQFGKIGKDIFTMDYRYPLSAFQAFAICLSSFDTKPACE